MDFYGYDEYDGVAELEDYEREWIGEDKGSYDIFSVEGGEHDGDTFTVDTSNYWDVYFSRGTDNQFFKLEVTDVRQYDDNIVIYFDNPYDDIQRSLGDDGGLKVSKKLPTLTLNNEVVFEKDWTGAPTPKRVVSS